jgi:hypothetical protein
MWPQDYLCRERVKESSTGMGSQQTDHPSNRQPEPDVFDAIFPVVSAAVTALAFIFCMSSCHPRRSNTAIEDVYGLLNRE